MRTKSLFILLAIVSFLSPSTFGQKVGVVLSGGGAKGAAHIGFLKALEENEIPIDYIAGSSMGAVIGAMYASGLTIEEIEAVVVSDEYRRMAEGEIDDELRYFFKEDDPNASMGTIKFNKGKLTTPTLPVNLINTALLDFTFMLGFSPSSAAAHYNFDTSDGAFSMCCSRSSTKRTSHFPKRAPHFRGKSVNDFSLLLGAD